MVSQLSYSLTVTHDSLSSGRQAGKAPRKREDTKRSGKGKSVPSTRFRRWRPAPRGTAPRHRQAAGPTPGAARPAPTWRDGGRGRPPEVLELGHPVADAALAAGR